LALAASLFLTLQYGWLLDDAFVYYRYVDNLVHLGRGLVFNAGEHVEGYSSPLWCLLLVPLRWIGLEWWTVVRLLGLACAAATWALLVVLARRTSPRGAPILNLPLAYLATNYAVQSYFTSGVETPLVQLVAVGFALYLVAPEQRAAQALVGLSPMVRHELALPFALAIAWSWARTRRVPWAPVAVGAATLGGWLAFRIAYYADLFPNTFYLKDELELARGWRYLHDTLWPYGAYFLAPALALLALALRRARVALDLGWRLAALAAAAAVTAYVVKIGGDPRHYRYLAFPFCLAVCASSGLVERALLRWRPGARPLAVGLAGAALAGASFALYPRQLSKHPIGRDAAHVKVDEINDAQYHRRHPDLDLSPWTLEPELEALDDAALDLIWGESPLLPPAPSSMRAEYARWRAAGEPATAPSVMTIGWCFTAWQLFPKSIVHKDGLTDAILARTQAESWRAGHKRDLHPLAADLVALRAEFGASVGGYQRALASGRAPEWIEANRGAVLEIARKAHNRGRFLENLRLALTRVPRIDPSRTTRDD
jgi:hypothetical protein